MRRAVTVLVPLLATLAGCAAQAGAARGAHPGSLADTSWTLVAFRSSDDAQGTARPPAGRVYALNFGHDGTVTMKLDCNRGAGTWRAEGAALSLGPAAVTRALCPQPDMGQALVMRLADVRGYVIRDGHLFLALKADASIYEFAPAPAPL